MPRKSSKETDINVTATGAAPRRAPAKTRSPRTVPAAVAVPAEAPVTEPAFVAAVESVAGPSREQIAKLAFLYWEARGYTGGSPEEDWLRAEQELQSLSAAATA